MLKLAKKRDRRKSDRKKWLTERYHAASDDLINRLTAGCGNFNLVMEELVERVAIPTPRPSVE